MPTPFQTASIASAKAAGDAATDAHANSTASAVLAQTALAQAELAKAHAIKEVGTDLALAIRELARAWSTR